MEQHAPTPPPTAAPTTTHSAPKYENLLNKIGDVLEADHGSAPAPVVAAHPPSKREDSLFDKLGDALGGSKHTATPPAPPVAVSEQRTTDKLLSKLEEKLTGKQAPPPPPAPKREETLVDKISDKLTGHKTPPPPPKEAHLLDKLANVITGKEEHPKPHGIADKINNALGGGAKGEAQEDKLDKGTLSHCPFPTQYLLSR